LFIFGIYVSSSDKGRKENAAAMIRQHIETQQGAMMTSGFFFFFLNWQTRACFVYT